MILYVSMYVCMELSQTLGYGNKIKTKTKTNKNVQIYRSDRYGKGFVERERRGGDIVWKDVNT